MNDHPIIPTPEIRARSAQKLRELSQQMDVLISQLDQINDQLTDDINQSPLTNYRLRMLAKNTDVLSRS
jgi:hypothetical protein